MDALPLIWLFAATLLLVVLTIEAGYRLGRRARARSADEKESPVSAIAGTVLGLLAFIMAFTFGIVSDRYDARKALVREEANAIRTAWLRSEFLPEPDRGEASRLLSHYLDGRIAAVVSRDPARLHAMIAESESIHRQLWRMAVTNARRDMNSDVAALYVESLNELINAHASRVAVGLYARIPPGIWLAFLALVVIGMLAVGYHTAIAASRRSSMLLMLGVAFSLVITLIAALDRSQGGYFPIPQQPLEAVRTSISAGAPAR